MINLGCSIYGLLQSCPEPQGDGLWTCVPSVWKPMFVVTLSICFAGVAGMIAWICAARCGLRALILIDIGYVRGYLSTHHQLKNWTTASVITLSLIIIVFSLTFGLSAIVVHTVWQTEWLAILLPLLHIPLIFNVLWFYFPFYASRCRPTDKIDVVDERQRLL